MFLEQKRAVRIISGMPPLSSCKGVFKSLKILSLASFYIYKIVAFTIKNIQSLQTVGEGHRFPTKQGFELRTRKHRLALSEREASYAGTVIFNKLPHDIKRYDNKTLLRKLKDYLIEQEYYRVEDYLSP